jgi:fructosamine-3-kinase
MSHDDVAHAVAAALSSRVDSARPIAGGDLNDALRVVLEDERSLFVKTRAGAAAGEFQSEGAALRWLGEPAGGPRVPGVLGASDAPPFLALAWIDSGSRAPDFEERLGRALARMHAAGAPAFGAVAPGTPPPRDGHAHPPTRLGPVVLPNDPTANFATFLAERRLRPLAEQADSARSLPGGTRAAIDELCGRLPELLGPPEPPARIHGDLWSGNVMCDTDGAPVLIDPAAHGGHRETDLAMLELFGARSARLLAAYDEVHPLADRRDERVELHQLVPLLVHAVLFGGGYGSRVAAVVRSLRR